MSIFDPELDGKTKHDRAVERIRQFCAGRRTLVAFSGGKDSQCCYHLARCANNPAPCLFAGTGFSESDGREED